MGFRRFSKGSHKSEEYFGSQHRFEHWYLDNQVYFITSRVRDKIPALSSEKCKAIFWERFEFYSAKHGFTPWATSLLDNHYHLLGHLRVGTDLPKLMRGLHGSVAKLVNDQLPERITPFWVDAGHQNYFDGCLRDEQQLRRSYRYVREQAVKAGLVRDWREYPHTRLSCTLEECATFCAKNHCLMNDVEYKRYRQRPR